MRRAVHRPTPPLLTKAFIRVGPDPRDPKGRRSIYRGVGEDAGQVRRQIIPPRSRQRRQGQATPEPAGPVQETIEPQNQETTPMKKDQNAAPPERDHRVLGRKLGLYTISPMVGSGLILWMPKGATVRHLLESYLRDELLARGYQPVVTPHIGRLEMYRTSGHYPHYSESQFPPMQVGEEVGDTSKQEGYLLKPMNCPHHIEIYKAEPRSYRDLPVRFVEFGTVYRHEQAGALSGMTRVRGFSQDDGHLFVTPEQVEAEVGANVDMAIELLSRLGMNDYRVRIGLRDPNSSKYVGSDAGWQKAEQTLLKLVQERGLPYEIGQGDAAFYGPKIDFSVKDSLGRWWQLGTVQLDYNLPERFDLQYIGRDGQPHRPVMIHRALFGSLERFMGILIEHYGGAFPLWLAPEQVRVVTISEESEGYARQIEQQLRRAGFRVGSDYQAGRVGGKIRQAQEEKIPYTIVIGRKEAEGRQVAVRSRSLGDLGAVPLPRLIRHLKRESRRKSNAPAALTQGKSLDDIDPPTLTKAILRGRDRRGRRWAYDTDLKKRVPYGDVPGTDPAVTQETTPMTEQPRTDDFHRPLPAARVSAPAAAPVRQVQPEERLWLGQGTPEDHARHHGLRHDPVSMLGLSSAVRRVVTPTTSRQILAGMVSLLSGPGLPELPPEARAAASVLRRACQGQATLQELNETRTRLEEAADHYRDVWGQPQHALVRGWLNGVDVPRPSPQAFLQSEMLRYAREVCLIVRRLTTRAAHWLESGKTLLRDEMIDMINGLAQLHQQAVYLRNPAEALTDTVDQEFTELERQAAEQRRLVEGAAMQLLRDVLGNPFDPVPANRVPVDTDVRVLALAARDDVDARGQLDPARLAVLADALEEQGADERLVTALRPDGRPRPAGLWALRQVLEVNGERP